MGLGDRAADRQPHADPIGLARVEGLEQSVELLRIEPRTGILHFDEHIVRFHAGHDRKLARSAADTAHRFDGIDDEIDEYLLQLDPIRREERQVSHKPALQADAIAMHFGLGQSDDFADCLIDVQEVTPRRHFLYERANAADDPAGASAIPDDTTERLSDFVQIRLSGAEPT
jgi:hypothetical protein